MKILKEKPLSVQLHVSILLIVELAFEADDNRRMSGRIKWVSILLIVELAFEVVPMRKKPRMWLSFNPSYRGIGF